MNMYGHIQRGVACCKKSSYVFCNCHLKLSIGKVNLQMKGVGACLSSKSKMRRLIKALGECSNVHFPVSLMTIIIWVETAPRVRMNCNGRIRIVNSRLNHFFLLNLSLKSNFFNLHNLSSVMYANSL